MRKEEAKVARERAEREKQDRLEEEAMQKRRQELLKEKLRFLTQSASVKVDIDEHGFVVGPGYLTVAEHARADGRLLETVLNFNKQLNDHIPAGNSTTNYRNKRWVLGKHTKTNYICVLGVRDPHYYAMDDKTKQTTVDIDPYS